MFEVTIGPTTTRVECTLIENIARQVSRTRAVTEDTQRDVKKILEILSSATAPGPRIIFTVGPVSERK